MIDHLALAEALSKENNLRNHPRVWHNHGDRSEHALQVVWQLSSTGIARIHGDEDTTSRSEFDLSSFKHESSGKV